MGKNSEFYKEKQKKLTITLRNLIKELPPCAVDYIHSKELTTQTSTLVSYCYDLLTFFRFLKEANPSFKNKKIGSFSYKQIESLNAEDIIEYQRYLALNTDEGDYHENGKKAIARKMAPLRGMFLYHFQHENIKKNPMILVPLPKLKKDKNIIRMSNYEVQAVMATVSGTKNQGSLSKRQRQFLEKTRVRDTAILTLMLGTGIRVSECNGLDIDDVDLVVNTITIVRKGGGQDVLYFGKEIHKALSDYIETERKLIDPVPGHEKALFFSLQGKRISVDSIENLVKKYSKIAVPTKKITPHKLRSTYGTALYRETGDIRLVADVLGHENINTTIDYYAAIEDEHKREAANAVDFNRKDT